MKEYLALRKCLEKYFLYNFQTASLADRINQLYSTQSNNINQEKEVTKISQTVGFIINKNLKNVVLEVRLTDMKG
ncbi:hypothetical protein R9C00_05935 [Flammeovirgaceae bacterium SG7u.111]|nr:hypothetical protein [Flammeovirgaceae bacterium SG7u.132]WPO36981.1 hypothetical protein R9C00_05935 [Flammeovirgaceae bacterium SG7u.111]